MTLRKYPDCPIWPGFRAKETENRPLERCLYVIESWRAGGDYCITQPAESTLNRWIDPADDRYRARLTTMVIDIRDSGAPFPMVTSDMVEQAKESEDLEWQTRADRLLVYLRTTIESDLSPIPMLAAEVWPSAMAHSESTTIRELDQLLKFSETQGRIQLPTTDMIGYEPTLTDAGIDHIETLPHTGRAPIEFSLA